MGNVALCCVSRVRATDFPELAFTVAADGRYPAGLAKQIHSHRSYFSAADGKFGQANTGFSPADMIIQQDDSSLNQTLESLYTVFKDVMFLSSELKFTSSSDAKMNQKAIQKMIWQCSEKAQKEKALSPQQPVCLLTISPDKAGVIEVRGPLKLRSRVVLHIPAGVTLKFVGTHRDYLKVLVEDASGEPEDREQLALSWFEASPIRGYHPPFQTDITLENWTNDCTVEYVGIVGQGSVDGGFDAVWRESAEKFFDFKAAVPGPDGKTTATQTYIREHIGKEMAVENRIIANVKSEHFPKTIIIDSAKDVEKIKKGGKSKPSKELPGGGAEFDVPDCWPCSRPVFIEFFRARNVLLHGITIKHSPMWSVHPVLTQNLWVNGVTIFTRGYNNDGVDPDMSQHVLIEGCLFSSSDDGVAIKAGRDTDGYDPPRLRENAPTQMYCEGGLFKDHILFNRGPATGAKGPRTTGVIVRGCKVLGELALPGEEGAPPPPEGFRNGVGVGSEGSAGVENVWLLGLEFEARATGVCLKTNPERRGVFRGVHMQGIRMQHMQKKGHALSMKQNSLMRTLNDRAKKGEGPLPDFQKNHMKSMRFEEITGTKIDAAVCGGGKAIEAESYSYKKDGQGEVHCPFDVLNLSDVNFQVEKTDQAGISLHGLTNVILRNVKMNGQDVGMPHTKVVDKLEIPVQ